MITEIPLEAIVANIIYPDIPREDEIEGARRFLELSPEDQAEALRKLRKLVEDES